ncbi:protocadherin alpha-6-like isoform X3 [Octopus vulgaris]|uniref:Protocadherin alpha-6-like isoform X3 n=1 Tax=Octopus vulgaris TaxID=6645 RepID=A0AA36FAZ9_OCTVU|nr:protocadherin alpha-6-like isoform X3 [Octopus vulgaris]
MKINLSMVLLFIKLAVSVDLTYHVKEGQRPGTFIGDITADTSLLDSILMSNRKPITFSQLYERLNGNSQLFNVTKGGKLYTTHTFDAESLCKYNSECSRIIEIAVQQEETFLKIIELKIIIVDDNDNPPEFPVKLIHLQFYESDKKGTTKSIPNAMDKDVSIANSQITYHLSKDEDEPFGLSILNSVLGTSKLKLSLTQELDREVKSHYSLQIVASNGGFPRKVGILKVEVSVIDENDHAPVFTHNTNNITISSAHQRNEPVITMFADDLDAGENGNVSYNFNLKTSSLTQSYFNINKNTGEIFLNSNFPFGKRQTYNLFIDATDHGSPPLSSTAIVLINVLNQQNNAPRIDVKFVSKSDGNVVSISEGVKVGSFIAYVKVIDNDSGHNGEVDCILNHDKFMLQSLGKNKYKVVIKSLVNRELESHMDLSIVCEDKGFPSLKTERKFSIEVMDVNDVQPYFTKSTFKFLTYENEEPNFPVGFINATDPDLGLGGQLSYSLFDEHGYVLPFKISNFGFITTAQSLDHEKQDMYEFKAIVKDNGEPRLSNTANVIVEVMDKNDNAPYFTFPSIKLFNIDVHYHPQSKSDITTLRASDRDSHVNSFLRYEILGGNDKQLFTVNPYTGVLSFSRTVYQNDAGSYNLKLAVKDNGTPVLSTTTTLSLTLTVSNTTARMYTAEDTESDNRIHINLMIIIVVAAVIVSVAIVVSVIVCIVHKRNQRHTHFNLNKKCIKQGRRSRYFCEQDSPKYDIPITVVTDSVNSAHSRSASLRRDTHTGDNSSTNWNTATTEIPHPSYLQEIHQTSELLKKSQFQNTGLVYPGQHYLM